MYDRNVVLGGNVRWKRSETSVWSSDNFWRIFRIFGNRSEIFTKLSKLIHDCLKKISIIFRTFYMSKVFRCCRTGNNMFRKGFTTDVRLFSESYVLVQNGIFDSYKYSVLTCSRSTLILSLLRWTSQVVWSKGVQIYLTFLNFKTFKLCYRRDDKLCLKWNYFRKNVEYKMLIFRLVEWQILKLINQT